MPGSGAGESSGDVMMLTESAENLTEEQQLERAIAESMGQASPHVASAAARPEALSSAVENSSSGGASGDGEVVYGTTVAGSQEEDDLAKAIALSMGEAKTSAGSEKQPQPEAPPAEWQCDVCTYINQGTSATCAMCGTGTRPAATSSSSSSPAPSSVGARVHRADSIADESGDRIELFHYNGLTRKGTTSSESGDGNVEIGSSGGSGGGGGGISGQGSGREARLVRFSIVKRSDEELVGAAVSLNTSGGLGGALMGSDHAIEDVLRTRWQGSRIDWAGQPPPSID